MFELNDDTRWILGRPNFFCGPIAHQLRRMGRDIPRKAEDEQAAVLHWMLQLWEQHGARWRLEANKELDVAADALGKSEGQS